MATFLKSRDARPSRFRVPVMTSQPRTIRDLMAEFLDALASPVARRGMRWRWIEDIAIRESEFGRGLDFEVGTTTERWAIREVEQFLSRFEEWLGEERLATLRDREGPLALRQLADDAQAGM